MYRGIQQKGTLGMTILALECSGQSISVALEYGRGYREIFIDSDCRHTESVMPAIDTLLNMAEISPKSIDLVACSAAPALLPVYELAWP